MKLPLRGNAILPDSPVPLVLKMVLKKTGIGENDIEEKEDIPAADDSAVYPPIVQAVSIPDYFAVS
jgi:hypothetical protein